MKNATSEDTFLLLAMQKGDRNAFDRLFQKYYPILCTYAYSFVRLEDAEEIVQDIMLWLWENRETTAVDYSLKQYLFKSVYNRSMTRIVYNETKKRIDAAYHERMFSSLEDIDVYQITEMSKHIQQAIDELPESYKEAFIMHRFRNLSYKEIAEILDVSPKTVDYRIQQSLKILRVRLKDYLPLLLILLGNSSMPIQFN